MKEIKCFNLDDLLCLYHCLELELQRLTLSCMPQSMRSYWNQLNKIQSCIHSEILLKENEKDATVSKQKTCKCK